MVGEEVIARTATKNYKIRKTRVTDRTITQFQIVLTATCAIGFGDLRLKNWEHYRQRNRVFYLNLGAKILDFRQKTRFLATRAQVLSWLNYS